MTPLILSFFTQVRFIAAWRALMFLALIFSGSLVGFLALGMGWLVLLSLGLLGGSANIARALGMAATSWLFSERSTSRWSSGTLT